MNRLVEIIGPAPTELPLPALISRLRNERERIRVAIEEYKAQTYVTKAKPKPKAKDKAKPKLLAEAKKLGMSPDDVLALIQKIKEAENK